MVCNWYLGRCKKSFRFLALDKECLYLLAFRQQMKTNGYPVKESLAIRLLHHVEEAKLTIRQRWKERLQSMEFLLQMVLEFLE